MPVTRTSVGFPSRQERCAAWLYEPGDAASGGCVVLAHGFGGVRSARLDAYAERFSQAGLRVLVFDYRHFGDSGGEPRQLLDSGRQLEDWRAAIAFARTLPGVAADRVVAWGTSFSGGHVAVIAAEDHLIAAVISQAPFLDGLWALRAAGPRNIGRMALAGVRDELARLRGRPPVMIPIVAPPGHVAAMNQPGAEAGYRGLLQPDEPFRNEVTARFGLRLGLYRPIRSASEVSCPWLLCVCTRDDVTPPQPAVTAAGRAPRAELHRYDAGHFDIYHGELFERAVADQLEFLRRTIVARP